MLDIGLFNTSIIQSKIPGKMKTARPIIYKKFKK